MMLLKQVGRDMGIDKEGRYMEFFIGNEKDVPSLPTAGPDGDTSLGPRPGSMAISLTGRVWMMNNARKWVRFGRNADESDG